MKRILLVFCMIPFLLNVAGCSNSDVTQTESHREERTHNEVHDFSDSKKKYVMETNEDAVIIPTMTL